MSYSLEQVDLVRERLGVGYAEAKRALDETDGDVISALAALEGRQAAQGPAEAVELMIREVRRALEGHGIRRVVVKLGDQTLTDAPVAVCGLGAVLLAVASALCACFRLELFTGEGGGDGHAD